MSTQEKVNQVLHKYLNKNDTVVLACSGGKDSLTALGTLLGCGLDLNIVVAHVDHNIRENSFKQAVSVGELCAELGVTFELKVLPKSLDHNENSLREQRIEFLEGVAIINKAKYIITGHTASDQLETILMRLVRGTGTKGLCGISERRGNFLRPLLKLTKEETTEYVKEKGWEVQYDQSNDSNDYTRNRFRNNIIPLLEKENPKVAEAINKLVESVQEDQLVLLSKTAERFNKHKKGFYIHTSPAVFNLSGLKYDSNAVVKRIIIRIWEDLKTQQDKQLTCFHINNVCDAIKNANERKVFDLPSSVRVTIEPKANEVVFERIVCQ